MNKQDCKREMHTPGPWILDERDPRDQFRNVLDGSDTRFGPVICRISLADGPFGRPREQSESNATLIAAAPMLLAALEELLVAFTTPFDASLAATLGAEEVMPFIEIRHQLMKAACDKAWCAIQSAIHGSPRGADGGQGNA